MFLFNFIYYSILIEKQKYLLLCLIFSVHYSYTGSNVKEKSKVYTPKTRKKLLKEDKCMIRRRSAIEPIIGHLKQYGRMGRNFLKGVIPIAIINTVYESII
ncbi:hypothetical protein [Candidatus Tisiphia endosymbiont of Parasteatoda lunata]|uniref:hypothetical protein n=1 Tax=Candidatus Tisiphia endosymbiont of Parasteatoda lunata TaxID=3066275 RepID=UPI00313C7731